MPGEGRVTFAVVDRGGSDPLAWTVSRELRTKRALAALGVLAAPLLGMGWLTFGFEAAALLVLLVCGSLFLYARFRQERTYTADARGLTIRWSGGKERFYPWDRFASYQTHSEYNDATSLAHGHGRRVSETIDDLGDSYGRWFILAPHRSWGYPVTIRTTPEVDDEVRALLDRVLEHRPDRGPNALMWAIGVGVAVLAVIGSVVAAVLAS